MDRFKQESLYGFLSAGTKKVTVVLREVAVVERFI